MLPHTLVTLKIESIGKTSFFLYSNDNPLAPVRVFSGQPSVREFELPVDRNGEWPPVLLKARIDRNDYLRITWTEPLTGRPCERILSHAPGWQETELLFGWAVHALPVAFV
ncbi:MAG: hypothetical protein EOO11_18450 [Chitinophagaceae bacterium]|nr:MAG: hypothetical protein EOO11_18450 [Chitinophagaceae bacterium]